MAGNRERRVDFTDSSYCKISRRLLTISGQWPDQSTLQRVILTTVFGTILLLANTTQIVKLIRNFTELEQITATVPPTITVLVTIIKWITFIVYRKNIRDMFHRLNEDWRTIKPEKEMEIIERYLKDGSVYALGYCILIYVTIITFVLLIFDTYLFDIVAPLNETRPLKTIYPADYYFFDEMEHFTLVMCHMIISSCVVVIVLTATDTTLIIFVQYACAMFSILGNRLQHSLYSRDYDKETLTMQEREIYSRRIVDCAYMHRRALEFVKTMEFTFSISHLIQLLFDVILMSVTLLQVVLLWGQLELIRYILYTIAQLFHIFYVSYQGQQLIDHSTRISNQIYNGMWYETPKEIQKLLLFMLIKTGTVSCLTAGKIINFSIETFSLIVQNSMSYFMMLSSLR